MVFAVGMLCNAANAILTAEAVTFPPGNGNVKLWTMGPVIVPAGSVIKVTNTVGGATTNYTVGPQDSAGIAVGGTTYNVTIFAGGPAAYLPTGSIVAYQQGIKTAVQYPARGCRVSIPAGGAPTGNAPTLEVGRVTPAAGDTTTSFYFEAVYRHPGDIRPTGPAGIFGEPAGEVKLVINEYNGGLPISLPPFGWVNKLSKNYVEGARYRSSKITLPALPAGAPYSFYFFASDNVSPLVVVTSETYTGPTVSPLTDFTISTGGTLDATLEVIIGEPAIGVTSEGDATLEAGGIYVFAESLPPLNGKCGLAIHCRTYDGAIVTQLSSTQEFDVKYGNESAITGLMTTPMANLLVSLEGSVAGNYPFGAKVEVTYRPIEGGGPYKAIVSNVIVQPDVWKNVIVTFITIPGPGIVATVTESGNLIMGDSFSHAVCNTGTVLLAEPPTNSQGQGISDNNGIYPRIDLSFAGTYDLAMTRSDSSTGRADQIPVASDYHTGVTVDFSKLPAGVVPLSISRDGSSISVTWEATDPRFVQPEIFVKTGIGEGEFTSGEGWVQITESGQLINTAIATIGAFSYSEGSLTHQDQVGANTTPEVYYKALRFQIAPEIECPDAPGKTYLQAAWAVGKYNIPIIGSGAPNQICLPLNPQDQRIDSVIGDQLAEGATIWGWTGQGYDSGAFNATTGWSAGVPVLFANKAYWILTPTATTITVTGAVLNENQNIALGNSTLYMMGNSFSNATLLTASGLSNILQTGDTVWRWTNTANGGYDSVIFTSPNSWSAAFDKLLPGRGFWVLRSSNTPKTWIHPKPY
jgi:hypothetical protein